MFLVSLFLGLDASGKSTVIGTLLAPEMHSSMSSAPLIPPPTTTAHAQVVTPGSALQPVLKARKQQGDQDTLELVDTPGSLRWRNASLPAVVQASLCAAVVVVVDSRDTFRFPLAAEVVERCRRLMRPEQHLLVLCTNDQSPDATPVDVVAAEVLGDATAPTESCKVRVHFPCLLLL